MQFLTAAVDEIATCWEDETCVSTEDVIARQHGRPDPVKTVLAALAHVESLVTEPHRLLVDMSTSYLTSRALHIAADHDIAGIIARAGEVDGLHIGELARLAVVDQDKLCRIMRALASQHVFREVTRERFANNHVSAALAGDTAFRAHIMMKGRVHYAASDYLPSVLKGHDLDGGPRDERTAFQRAVDTDLTLFDWMNQEVPEEDADRRPKTVAKARRLQQSSTDGPTVTTDDEKIIPSGRAKMVSRPEKTLFHQAMAGLDRGQRHFYVHEYPWRDLGAGTVVDVGGGIGFFCMQLHAAHPALQLVVQDREPVIEQAASAWAFKHPDALASGQVQLSAHDFFAPNPVRGAEVYWLRYILHDWPDTQAGAILASIAASMTASSRLLIANTIVSTTVSKGDAPAPLLPNYGRAASHAHAMDLTMMMMVDGRERTPGEFEALARGAGLEVVRIWRGGAGDTLGVVECRLAASDTVGTRDCSY
ncbi:hypothetical protein LQW54_012727 [Pestalotiopsis sp. IQ-011]